MLPAEHPEFFRRPPPAGQSRESSIRLDAEGRFWHAGELVRHPGMQAAFATWIRRHPDDGRYVLCNGYDWTYLTVEGPAYFVSAVRAVDARPELELLDGRTLPLDPQTLSCDAEGKLWVRLPEGEQACFTAAAQLELAPWLVEKPDGIGVQIAGQFSPITH